VAGSEAWTSVDLDGSTVLELGQDFRLPWTPELSETIDELLGSGSSKILAPKLAPHGFLDPENLEKLKLLFDKVKDMYDIVFFITHNDIVKDWADNVVTVVKNNNLSKITFN
jgi:hypothetical protein